MSQQTLVAFYGEKPEGLSAWIQSCRNLVAAHLGEAFVPYSLNQVHATIVGMEHSSGDPRRNANFERLRQDRRIMDIPGFLEFLRQTPLMPFTVQFGGFRKAPTPFRSRNQSPHDRSFSIQSDKVVVMGWPVEDGGYPRTLAEIRRGAEAYGILHAYHASPQDEDNDLFLRLGMLRADVTRETINACEAEMRAQLGNHPPHLFELTKENLVLVDYVDPTLPLNTTRPRALRG